MHSIYPNINIIYLNITITGLVNVKVNVKGIKDIWKSFSLL